MFSGSSAPDPFSITEYPPQGTPNGIGYNITRGRTLISSALNASRAVIIVDGQSLMATANGAGAYTTLSALANNLNIYDGGIYLGADPVLGASFAAGTFSSPCMRLADSIITRGKKTQVVVVPIAIGGTVWAHCVPLAAGTLFNRLTTAILRCRARGYEPDSILIGRGETDVGLGTSAASITASIQAIVAGIRAAPISCNTPVYINQHTWNGSASNAPIRAGYAAALSGPSGILAGFDCDTLTGANRLGDGVHLSDAGLAAYATGMSTLLYP